MIILDIPQLSPAWFSEKAGKPGASSFHRIVSAKGERQKAYKDYLYQLAGEAITGVKEESYSNKNMQVGIEREEESRSLYELIYGVEVEQVGLIYPDESRKYLCSPDGIVNREWGLEMKNVIAKTQAKYLLNGKLPTDYSRQVQGSMLVTGFKTWHFMSYHPGMKPFILEVKRDEEFISKLRKELDSFCAELAMTINKLKNM
jgi:predicted phage-related endonuclease